jgi:hypothetical protein
LSQKLGVPCHVYSGEIANLPAEIEKIISEPVGVTG